MATRKIPKFKSLQEEAEFWDTHSPLDFPAEFEDVEDVKFVRAPKEVMTLRVDKATVDLIKRVARRLGMPPTTLARVWLVERATQEARTGSKRAKRARKTGKAAA